MDETIEANVSTKPAHRPAEQTNVKETIESILVAFILAFIFRAFVVEAFVIPTGSMAPTLLGAHMRYRCDDCGYDFQVNYSSSESEGDDVSIPPTARLSRAQHDSNLGRQTYDKTFRIHCPNCLYRFPRVNPSDPANVAMNPPVFYGDRILVLKYLYLLTAPQRWDVVVFKSPDKPERFDYTQNYIKRLLGRPGESLMVLDGDVYVSTKGEQSQQSDFVVQPKPRWAQEALWRIVHDNDFQPRGRPRTVTNAANLPIGADPAFVQPWMPLLGEVGWDLSERRVFKFKNSDSAATLDFNAEANQMPGAGFAPAMTDWLAYDITLNQQYAPDMYLTGGYVADNNVSDVKLAMHYQRVSGEGPLKLNLVLRPKTDVERTFIAEIGRTQAKLIMRDHRGAETIIGTESLPTDCSSATRVELIAADYRVTLRVAEQDLISTTPQQFAPDLTYLLNNYNSLEKLPKPQISVTAERQTARITHVSVWRDVYFTNRERGTAENITRRNNRTPLQWASPEKFPAHVIHLGADEFFTCGDNSIISGDGRYWQSPINLPDEQLTADAGRVPARFLLGKAFFVYWPAGYKPLPGESVPAIVPNFGRMRFIH